MLWGLLIFIAVLSVWALLKDVFGGTPTSSRQVVSSAVFPDDEMRSFASRFASAYLTHSPSETDEQSKAVDMFMASDLRGQTAARSQSDGRPQRVLQSWTARARRTGEDRGVVTVASIVTSRSRTSTIYLSVPVARVGDRVVVDDFPAVVAPPVVSEKAPPSDELPLPETEAASIEALLTRFMREYLSGGPDAAAYVVPGKVVRPIAYRLVMREVVSLSLAREPRGKTRDVMTTVIARDTRTRAEYVLRYVVTVEMRDTWLVRSVQN